MDSFLSPDIKLQYSISNLISPRTDNILTEDMLLNWDYFTDIKILNGDTINPTLFLKNACYDNLFSNKIISTDAIDEFIASESL